MPDAFSADYHTTKYVMGRKVMQVILEVPMEMAHQVYAVLGYPDPHASKRVAVALLREDHAPQE